MGTYPTSPRSAFLEWCQAHESVFTTNASKIGLTLQQADAFRMATDTAAAAALAHEQAKLAAKVATQAAGDAFGTLRSRAGDTVKLIKAFAANSANPSEVYQLAQIPPPAPPSPAPPPGQPRDLTVELEATRGAITLRWKCDNPPGTSGTAYIVRRKLPGEADFSFIGVTGTKKFADDTLIAGPDSVQYTVQGQRADSSGPVSPIFTVNFGRLPGGLLTASVANGTATGGGTLAADRSLVDAIVNSKPLGNGHPARERARA
jgi:hypothetical protein